MQAFTRMQVEVARARTERGFPQPASLIPHLRDLECEGEGVELADALERVPGLLQADADRVQQRPRALVRLPHLLHPDDRAALRALAEEALREGGQLVALAADELLGRDLEVADEAARHGLPLRQASLEGRRRAPPQPAQPRPVRDLVHH